MLSSIATRDGRTAFTSSTTFAAFTVLTWQPLGTSLFGVMVDKMGWHGGFYLLMGGIVCCILFCYLSHRGALELEQQRKNTQQQEAELALADAR